jgi:oxygen-dependent protoporphyrinogen oxidase
MWPPTDSRSGPRIAVIGGGITGLAAAHRLIELGAEKQRPPLVSLFEASGRIGGVITTERRDGFVIEWGPDSFLSEKPWGLQLSERLGLDPEIIGTREEWRRTYVVHGGRLHPLPDGFLLLAPTRLWPLLTSPLFSWPGKLRMAMDLFLPRGDAGDESLASFVRRRLGREALERVAQPLVGGIYTADPERLSLAATMPRFLEMEREHRSVIAAMWRQQRQAALQTRTSGARWSLFVSFRQGMQSLVDRLGQRLPEGTIRLRTPIRTIERGGSGWRLNGSEPCDAAIVATPAHASAELLRSAAPALAAELEAIPYASSITVNLVYRREEIPHPLDGFGFVVPHVEGRKIIACSFSSFKYSGRAPAELVLLRAFAGGALQPELFALDDEAIEDTVRSELRALLGIVAEPLLKRIARYLSSMPQYHVGHLERLARIEQHLKSLPGLALAGGAYRGVGIPDCIHSGETAAAAILKALQGQQGGGVHPSTRSG